MSGFDLGNIGGMMSMFQDRMRLFKEQSAALRCTGAAGGGLVKVTMSGTHEVISVSIAPAAMDDRELLEDVVRAATSDATRQIRTEVEKSMKSMTGGLPIPPGMMPF